MNATDSLAYAGRRSGWSSGEAVNLSKRAGQKNGQSSTHIQSNVNPSHGHPSGPDKEAASVQKASRCSTSSSDYSHESVSDQSEKDNRPKITSSVRRRSSIPSEGGADRRRLAIVQMDSLYEHHLVPQSSSDNIVYPSNNLRSRRGIQTRLGDLALVAPPDAAVESFVHQPVPSTAPIASDGMHQSQLNSSDDRVRHHRSASEIVGSKKRQPRDVGIVGTSPTTAEGQNKSSQSNSCNKPLRLPIFQMPKSRSSSPGDVSDSSEASHVLSPPENACPPIKNGTTGQTILTAEIKEEKEIHVPVTAPVVTSMGSSDISHLGTSAVRENPTPEIVVDPAPSPVFSSTKPLTYLHYQPGLHAIAGPLPPPPRATFTMGTNSPPPPRPPRLHSPPPRPRDMEAVKQALQLPKSVFTVLAATSPPALATNRSSKSEHSSQSTVDPDVESPHSVGSTTGSQVHEPTHTREGAFVPSRIILSDSETSQVTAVAQISPGSRSMDPMDDLVADIDNAIDDAGIINASDIPKLTVVKSLHHSESLGPEPLESDPHREDDRFNNSLDLTPRRPSSDFSTSSASRSRSPPPVSREYTESTPSPPPKSFRNVVKANLKRLSSLPRTPSFQSHGRPSSVGYTSRTSSPSSILPPPVQRHKIISQSPSAMFCMDVVTKKTAIERCIGYAQKINELYVYDCGLSDWVMEVQCKDPKAKGVMRRDTVAPSAPFTHTQQPRHASRTSMISEVTFPRRPDATTATDLTGGANHDTTPPTAMPALPYPSLAQPPSRSPPSTPPSSMRVSSPSTPKATGFFASLGRKASIKKDKAGLTSHRTSSSGKTLTKSPPAPPNPRPINIQNSPTVPGGPRAPPYRTVRSQTITISSPFSANSSRLKRRGSMAQNPASTPSSEAALDIQTDPEFVRQVDKLADLLPHADREVLTGYLRRAGQDILAIGQYLEDEKNGTIRRD